MKRKGTVLSFFDYTGIMVKPWADAGHFCYCFDIRHNGYEIDGNIAKVKLDIMNFEHIPAYGDPDILFFFPPCTDTAISGARWFKDKGLWALIKALELFAKSVDMAEYFGAPYMIENPITTVSTYYRKPDHYFQPWQYGDLWTKKTSIWCGNGFIMPEPTHKEKPHGVRPMIHYMAPGEDRAAKRSETPPGFARAVFEANARR